MFNTVMLIHGAWLTPAAWDRVRRRYAVRGLAVSAPAWPATDMPLDRLRQWPPPELGRVTLAGLVDHHEALVRRLPEPPILVGHALGGLVVQLLLDRGLGAAGVALAPLPFRRLLPRPGAVLRALPSPRALRKPRMMPYERFARDLAQTLPEAEKRPAYDLYVAPTAWRVVLQAVSGFGSGISRKNPRRPPLLLVAAEGDRAVPPSAVRAAYEAQRRAPSPTSFKCFPGRSHFLFAEPGWEEVADFALDWALANAWPVGGLNRTA